MARASRTKGFSMIELIIVIAIIMIMAAAAIPLLGPTLQNYRLRGDARNIASLLALARIRAASDFTRAEVCFDFAGGICTPTSQPNTYQVELWNKTTNAFAPEPGTFPQALSKGDFFPANSVLTAQGIPPTGGQTTIGQGTGVPGPPVASVQIIFNSRGIAIDPVTLNPVGTDAIYISNTTAYCAVTASLAGQTATWRYVSNAWSQM